jgi:hypothetical protein
VFLEVVRLVEGRPFAARVHHADQNHVSSLRGSLATEPDQVNIVPGQPQYLG